MESDQYNFICIWLCIKKVMCEVYDQFMGLSTDGALTVDGRAWGQAASLGMGSGSSMFGTGRGPIVSYGF